MCIIFLLVQMVPVNEENEEKENECHIKTVKWREGA